MPSMRKQVATNKRRRKKQRKTSRLVAFFRLVARLLRPTEVKHPAKRPAGTRKLTRTGRPKPQRPALPGSVPCGHLGCRLPVVPGQACGLRGHPPVRPDKPEDDE